MLPDPPSSKKPNQLNLSKALRPSYWTAPLSIQSLPGQCAHRLFNLQSGTPTTSDPNIIIMSCVNLLPGN